MQAFNPSDGTATLHKKITNNKGEVTLLGLASSPTKGLYMLSATLKENSGTLRGYIASVQSSDLNAPGDGKGIRTSGLEVINPSQNEPHILVDEEKDVVQNFFSQSTSSFSLVTKPDLGNERIAPYTMDGSLWEYKGMASVKDTGDYYWTLTIKSGYCFLLRSKIDNDITNAYKFSN